MSYPPLMVYYREWELKSRSCPDWHWEATGCLCLPVRLCGVMLRCITCTIKHFLTLNCLCEVMSGSGSPIETLCPWLNEWQIKHSCCWFNALYCFRERQTFVIMRWKTNVLHFVVGCLRFSELDSICVLLNIFRIRRILKEWKQKSIKNGRLIEMARKGQTLSLHLSCCRSICHQTNLYSQMFLFLRRNKRRNKKTQMRWLLRYSIVLLSGFLCLDF